MKKVHSQQVECRIQNFRKSLDQLRRDSIGVPHGVVNKLLEQLSLSLEELQTAEDELSAQSEELLVARKTAERERQRYLELFESAPGGCLVTSPSGNIQELNRAAAELLETTQPHLLGKHIAHYLDPELRREFLLKISNLSPPEGSREFEIQMLGCKGRSFHAAVRVVAVYSQNQRDTLLRWHVHDITAKKETEERLRHMSNQLLTVQEEERKRISMELHDSIGQYLSAAKFSVENILVRIGDKMEASERRSLEAIVPILQSSIGEVRRIYTDLRPPVLDEMGIVMTTQWFCRQFNTIYPHIDIEKKIELDEDDVPDLLKVVLFRVMQEAFHNIARHSGADKVILCLGKNLNKLQLSIRDNGTGFQQSRKEVGDYYRKGLGLMSMRERTELSGGTFSIESFPRGGTHILATWLV
jgi:PAS domain S-box-containing protein